jgi:transcription antitermination factor NusG
VKWHAIYSTPAGEFRAMLGIDAAHIEAFLPVERVRCAGRYQRDMKVAIRSLLPRYLFARFDAGRDLGRVLQVDGVEDVLRVNEKLSCIDDHLIEAMRRAQELGVFDRTTNRLALEEGATVEIKDKRMEGLIARVKASRAKDRIRVILDNGMVMSVPANRVAKAG